MPNIFKRFLQPNASDFVFPDVEELVEEGPADTAGEQEGEPEESAPETEEKDTPSAVDFAQIQAEKILEDARRQAEDYLVPVSYTHLTSAFETTASKASLI